MSDDISTVCLNCGRHHSAKDVRTVLPAEHEPDGEVVVEQCPICGSFDLEELLEVTDA